ncbi:MAG: hypothetical protein LBN95_14325 [Prevotellaceae bacterium]|jgi:hypothetical protein|nr:hypothetical protein [Prevotellaceae bacterium]
MKKFVFPLVAALVAAFSFTSCGSVDPDPDATLKADIVKIGTYTGVDSDGDAWTATFTETTFSAACPSYSITLMSTDWNVISGELAIYNVASASPEGTGTIALVTGVIGKDGKELILTLDAAENYTLTLKK